VDGVYLSNIVDLPRVMRQRQHDSSTMAAQKRFADALWRSLTGSRSC